MLGTALKESLRRLYRRIRPGIPHRSRPPASAAVSYTTRFSAWRQTMKTTFRKLTALLASLSITASLALPAAASEALGDDLTARDTLLNRQTQLSTNVFWSESGSDFRTENLITYEPNGQVTPIVTCGSVVTEKSTVTAMARNLEAQGRRVVAGINGDFYVVGSGVPVGLVMTEGRLRSSDGGFHAIGFRSDGTAVLGKPGITVDARFSYMTEEPVSEETPPEENLPGETLPEETVPGETLPEETLPGGPLPGETLPDDYLEGEFLTNSVPAETYCRPAALNKGRDNSGVFLYTYDFNAAHTTGTTQPGVDVVCTIQEGDLSIGGVLTAVVDRVVEDGSATAVGPNQLVFSVNLAADAGLVEKMRKIPAGATVTLTTQATAQGWEDVEYAVGALYALVENGAVVPGLAAGAAPRTAVGQRPDGTVIFYTIDGRRAGHSIGASMSQVARRMLELGCETALCLDGGGSTTLSVTDPDKLTAQTVNRPSDGSERAVTNHIFLVAGNEPSGDLGHFYVSAADPYVLAGSKTVISAAAVDTNFIPMQYQQYTLSASDGVVEDGVLTTPSQGGNITVTALGRGGSGSTTVYAVTTPDTLTIRDSSGNALTSVTAAPGTITALAATAAYRHKPLKADPEAFTWTVDEALGSIDALGNFTASGEGSGSITVTAGGRSVSVPVTVTPALPENGGSLKVLENFEGDTTIFRGGGSNLEYSLTNAGDFVRLGRGAGKISYTLTESGGYTAQWRAAKPSAVVSAPYTGVSLWVYGDGSNVDLALLFGNNAGGETALPIATLDFTGWRQVTAEVPFDGAILQGLRITSQGLGKEGKAPAGQTGTVYIDHIMASSGGLMDNEPPAITASLDQDRWEIRASVLDTVDGLLPESAVTVSFNGKPVTYTYDAASGTVSFALPGPGESQEAMRVTVTARDVSGNIGRASVDVAPSGVGHKFTDTEGYWAADYADFLYLSGVTTGYADGTFRPDQNISRAQFAAMLYRYLGLKDEDYAGVALPFADNGSIPAYAEAAVRALYAEGVINGNTGKDGKLYFNPNASLSRAQAAAMIGRTQEKGYAVAELAFTDSGDIPAYAAFYVRTMAAQGVIGGYTDGAFRPHNPITRGQMAKILYTLM